MPQITRLFVMFLMLSLMAEFVTAVDLSAYPNMFVQNGRFNAFFVVGDHADIADAIGAVDVATSLQSYTKTPIISAAKLASEITSLNSTNLVVIGGPCANPIAAHLFGYPQNCMQGFTKGRAVIKVFETKNALSIVIAGATAADTRRACRAIANFNDYKDQFRGNEIEVTGTSLTDVVISRVS